VDAVNELERATIRAAVLKVLVDRITAAFKAAKEDVAVQLGPEGRKNAVLGGEKLASVSVTKNGRFSVHNPELFLSWVERNYPSEIYEVPSVRPAFLEAIRKASEAAGQPCTPDGTLDIPGVSMGDPYPLVRKVPGADKIIEDMWQKGRLNLDGDVHELE
jgi:hypothetical protein